ncbi:MAG: hypothetical protein KGL39_47525, partial [Patescibacteria group bacterium]|nr:hypothetical protein [Patescibacteria group bacterium]
MAWMKFRVEAGALVRGSVRQQVEDACWQAGLECEVRESKRFLQSTYYFKLSGDNRAITEFAAWFARWSAENAEAQDS